MMGAGGGKPSRSSAARGAFASIAVRRPIVGIEIAVHQEFGERKEAKDHGVGQHFPARLARHGSSDPRAIGGEIDLVLVLEIFDYEPELELHLRLQREVRRRGFVTSLEMRSEEPTSELKSIM